jgi:glucokinase
MESPQEPADPGPIGFVGDIGGTNCRLALVDWQNGQPTPRPFTNMLCADYPTAVACIDAWLKTQPLEKPPRFAVLAVAGPVRDGDASLANNPWHLSEAELQAELGLTKIRLINDFAILAVGVPYLNPSESVAIGPNIPGRPGGTIAVMGPGTGFGLAGLAGGTRAGLLVTEGGHISFAPTDDTELAILRIMLRARPRVSIERILAGPGMARLHAALEELGGKKLSGLEAPAITQAAIAGDPDAVATINRFCAILGSVAGDLALALGAEGGVFIAGGIAPRLLKQLPNTPFRQRFEAKGRRNGYMQLIPTRVITTENVAMRGAAHELASLAGLE